MKRFLIIVSCIAIIIGCGYVIVSSVQNVNKRVSRHFQETPAVDLNRPQAIEEIAMASSTATQPVVEKADLSNPGLKIEEHGHHHVALSWEDNEMWFHPWIIQRSTKPEFIRPVKLKHNQAADNTHSATFRWLGINANNYVDLDGLAENITYYYRVAAVTNMSEHRTLGTPPAFSDWIYGSTTTRTLEEKHKQVFSVTDERFGAVANDGENDYPAILEAMKAAQKARGGTVWFPAGTYDLWPTDEDVQIIDGLPTLNRSGQATRTLFEITRDNITFAGETQNGNPASFLKLYLWGKTPATQYLNVLDRQGMPIEARRYFLFLLDHVENFTLKDLDIDGGANPVSSGKRPGAWGLEFMQTEWDESHKLIASFGNGGAKNVLIENVDTRNWRGEVYYNGGGSEKWLIKDGSIRWTNSSAISGSFDLELVNMVIAEAANACVESALFSKQRSKFNNRIYNQNHIARGCTFIGLDQSAEGVMKDLPGDKTFIGWLCFNQEGTYQTLTDSTFRDTIHAGFAPWYEYRNGFLFNTSFGQIPENKAGRIIQLNTTEKKQYQLKGGMSEILWMDNTLLLERSLPNHQPVFSSIPGAAARGNQSPWIWEGFHIQNTSGKKLRINRFWVDSWNQPEGRQQVIFEDFTKDANIRFDKNFLFNTKEAKIHPTYRNFFK